MSAAIQKYLRSHTRQRVPHPDGDGSMVRVIEVTRKGWSFKHGDRTVFLPFEDMTEASCQHILNPKSE